MIKRSHVLVACIWLLCGSSLFSQVGFSLPMYNNTSTGQILSFPVAVQNFDSVFGIQFVLEWNPAVIEFQSIEHVVNPLNLVDSLNFNLNNVSSGNLRFLWNTNSFRTLQNTSAIYTVKFKVIGQNGTFSNITFTEIIPTLPFEIVHRKNGQNVFYTLATAILNNGRVIVGTVGTNDIGYGIGAIQVFPNPAGALTHLSFEATTPGAASILLTDPSGRQITREHIQIIQGVNRIPVSIPADHAGGLHFLHLSTDFNTKVFPLILTSEK